MKPHELTPMVGDGARLPSATELRAPTFAVGSDAQHPFGVLYQGEWETEHDGTAAAVRLHARALADTGLPVLLKSFSNVVVTPQGAIEPAHVAGIAPGVRAQCDDLRSASIRTLFPLIKHAVVRSAEQLRNLIVPKGLPLDDPIALVAARDAIYRSTILYSVWERDRVESEIVRQLDRCAQCWVPCAQNRSMLIESGVPAELVHVVPHPYDPASAICKLTRRQPRPGRRFYSIGRWEPRKGYHELIQAFLLAFGPEDDATLTIKTSAGSWPDYVPYEKLVASMKLPGDWTLDRIGQRINVIAKVLPPDQILKLHYLNNIYVCSSHGEAWSLPSYEARLAGNRLIHIPYGGTADFAGLTDIAVPFAMAPVHPSYGWGDAQWAGYRVEDLADALRSATAPVEYGPAYGFAELFSMQAVGARMADLVLQVADSVSGDASGYLRSCRRVRA